MENKEGLDFSYDINSGANFQLHLEVWSTPTESRGEGKVGPSA